MYRALFPSVLLAELDRLQRDAQRIAGPATSIRGYGRNGFPARNVGGTPDSVEIYAFAPGLARYQRAFTLAQELDRDKVGAEFNNGVVKLHIPKAEHAIPRKIEIRVS